MNNITQELLKEITDYDGTEFKGAYSIREDGGCVAVKSTENITIEPKSDKPGINITIKPNTVGETAYIPACVTKAGIDDLVYNDFYIGENCDVTIVAGCGVHAITEDEEARHNGIHRFFISKGAKVKYVEKHIGTGSSRANRAIDPVTDAYLKEDSYLEMDTTQIKGVERTTRKTSATLDAGAKLVIREKLMTDDNDVAYTDFVVTLNGENSGADVVSRSVAKGNSLQSFRSKIIGNTVCTGHSECDGIIAQNGRVLASPELEANSADASLIHEAAIGKIAGEQIIKLQTLGLTEEEAEAKIIEGFLK